jgi:hypothetical protein
MKGLGGWGIYLEAQWRGPQAAPSFEKMLDMLGKSPDMGFFLHGVSFPSEGDQVCVREHSILGTLLKAWSVLLVGHLFARLSTREN